MSQNPREGLNSDSASVANQFLTDAQATFEAYKKLADKAIAQVNSEELFSVVDEEANSIAVIMKHIAGNMRSRWTNFLTSDGEKPWRNRDAEFVIAGDTAASLFELWEEGWRTLFSALAPLTESDFARPIFIRGEAHTLVQAINRQLTHYAYHIGQIVFLAKHFRSGQWKSLSIPKNKSAAFNEYLAQSAEPAEDRFVAAERFVEKQS